jgi:hypothetical protein
MQESHEAWHASVLSQKDDAVARPLGTAFHNYYKSCLANAFAMHNGIHFTGAGTMVLLSAATAQCSRYRQEENLKI